ncbi:unnamed protein product [Orchesella dallaii]|uniref:Uncharacterized protein n=1 Tax=Orchesella dallaii TaxID=48710 RepID=A0ABP1PN58_9HEXA
MSVIFLIFALGVLACEANTADHKEIPEGDCKSHYSTWDHVHYLRLTGNESLPEADLQELCLRVNRKGIISYHDAKTTLFSCNYTWSKPVHCYSTESKPHPHAVGTITITLVWMDDTSRHLLLVLCASEAKQKYWLLASNEAVIDSKIKTKVLNTISGLGFDRKKVLYQDHSKCTEVKFKNDISNKMQFLLLLLTLGVLACAANQTYHDSIMDGHCHSKYPWAENADLNDVRRVIHGDDGILTRDWWVLMTSKHLAYHLGLQFLGNDSLSEFQFQELCLRLNEDGIFSLLDPNNMLVICNITNLYWMFCHFPDSNPHVVGELEVTVAWADDNHYNVLIVFCASESIQPYWLLISRFPLLLEDGLQTKVLDIVSDLGFDNDKVFKMAAKNQFGTRSSGDCVTAGKPVTRKP